MAVTIKHAKTDNIADWTQGDLDAQIALGNYPPGTVLADIVLPSDWNNDHTISGTVPIANGGTGQTTANTAINALLPSQTSNAGKVLSTNGTDTSWISSGGTGTVTSVALTAPSIFSVAGSPVTASGTLALSYSGTALPVANGGTGVTISSGANSVVLRDANANITTNCLFEGFTSQAASTLITLTASSVQNWNITGSGGQTIKLPNATTLPNGALFTFNNNQSSGAITVQNNSSTTIDTIQSGGFSIVTLLDNSTAAGTWDKHNQSPSNVSWSTNTFDYPGSITSATWNGTAIALNRGGTNANLTAVNGGAVYSTGTALAISAAGTSGQVLTSSGAGAPTWTTPTTGTVTSVTGTSPVVSSGGATPAISMPAATTSVNGYLTSTDWTTFNNKGSGTVTSVAALTLGTTGTDLSSTVATGTTTPVITLQVPTASASNRGALSAADWTTFNNKGSGTVTSASVVSANGFAGTVATATTTPAITLTTSITGILSGNGTAISAATTTGSGSVVLATSPTLTTPTLGVASATSVNKVTVTTPATGSTLTLVDGSTLATSGAFSTTLTATATTNVTLPTTGTLATLAGTETLTNKRITPRVSTTTSSATPTINTDTTDQFGLTALAVNITSFTTNLSGTPTDGQKLWIYIVGTAARTITWGAKFESSTVTLPSTTVTTNRLDVGFVWNAASSVWRCVAVA